MAKQKTLKISPETHKKFKAACDRTGTKLEYATEMILVEWLRNFGATRTPKAKTPTP